MSETRFTSLPIRTPVDLSAFHYFPTTADITAYMEAQARGELDEKLEYGRYGNTTRSAVEEQLIRLELGRSNRLSSVLYDALVVADGMRAVTATLSAIVLAALNRAKSESGSGERAPAGPNIRAGTHIIVGAECYKKIRQFCETRLRLYGVEVTVIQTEDYATLERFVRPETCLVFAEAPTNPYLRVADLGSAAAVTKQSGIPLVVDSTFASPHNLKALEIGANVVIHSATKYLSGHNNLLAGVVVGEKRYLELIRDCIGVEGGVLDAAAAGRLEDGLRTFELRVEEQNRRGLLLAQFLESHLPGSRFSGSAGAVVDRVWYPHLPSHPDYEVAKRILTGCGGVVSFELRGSYQETLAFLDYLRVFKKGASFGGVDSLIQPVALMSYSQLSSEERGRIGIRDNLIRVSVGTAESFDELLDDLSQAFKRYAHRFRISGESRVNAPARPNSVPGSNGVPGGNGAPVTKDVPVTNDATVLSNATNSASSFRRTADDASAESWTAEGAYV